jgi:hypothetical protein
MKPWRVIFPGCRALCALLALTGIVGLAPGASGDKKQADDAERPQPVLRDVSLRFITADKASEDLRILLGPAVSKRIRIVPDGRTNTLFVVAAPADQEQVARFLKTLDMDRPARPAGEQPRHQFRIMPIIGIVPDKYFEAGLNAVLPKSIGTYSVDERGRQLIVAGSEEAIRIAETYLLSVRHSQEQSEPKALRVRVVWLEGGTSRKDAAAVPADMKKVADELVALGVSELRLVAQSVVQVRSGAEFKAEGVGLLDAPCTFSVNGTLRERLGGDTALKLSVAVTIPGGQKVHGPLCRLATEIVAPLGHFVVLGVTPTAATTSVFVVQVLPAAGTPAVRPKTKKGPSKGN